MRGKASVVAWVIAIIVIILIIASAWYVHEGRQAPGGQTPAAASTAPVPPKAPAIRHPIAQAASSPAPAASVALPTLAKSDPAVKSALARLSGSASLGKLLANAHLIQRIVATINALPSHHMGGNILPVFPPAGTFATDTVNGQLVIAPSDYKRYDRYMKWVRHVDVPDLVAWYVRYYPLFQKAYRKLGYPHGYFNDRLVTVIDHLLKAPEPKGPVALVKTATGYNFADPRLQSLSVGQKLMVRVGPANEKQLKQKLRAIRAAVTGQQGPPAAATSAP